MSSATKRALRSLIFVWIVAPFTVAALHSQTELNYSESRSYVVGAQTRYIETADLDSDGDQDVILISEADETLVILKNDGVGNLTVTQSIDVGAAPSFIGSNFIKTYDLDTDGDTDIMITVSDQNDGWIGVFHNDGAGTFSEVQRSSHGVVPISILVADYNLDGTQEIAVANYRDSKVTFCDILPDGTLGQTYSRIETYGDAQRMVQADFDGNGTMDLALTTRQDPYIVVHFNKGSKGFSGPVKISLNSYSHDLIASDIDGDQDEDLVVIEQVTGMLRVFRNENGEFSQSIEAACGPQPRFFTVGDADGDGDSDFAVSNAGETTVHVILNEGSGTSLSSHSFTTAYHPFAIKFANLDGGSLPHLLVGFKPSDLLRIYVPGQNKARISGRVFYDLNNSCEKDAADEVMAHQIIEVNPGPHYFISNANGEYDAFVDPGNWEVSVVNNRLWEDNCSTGPVPVLIADNNEQVDGIDFALEAVTAERDLAVSIVCGRARPGREMAHVLTYRNTGTIPFNGTLTLTTDFDLTNVDFSVEPDFRSENEARWFLTQVPIGFEGTIVLFQELPRSLEVGSFLCAQAAADVKRNDQLLVDHNDEVCTEVTAGYDPNDIQVWPRGEGAEGRISTDVQTLSYMIRFQNTGNDTTFNVTVRDTLPTGLDIRRLRFGASSHNYKVSLLDNNILEFYFENIMLPDSTTDQLGSQGFVKYRVDLVENLAIGTSVKNRAGIYFDYNDVVLTNKAVSTIGGGSTGVGGKTSVDELTSAPNPIDGEVSISNIQAGVESLVLYDVGGRVLMRIPTNGLGKVTVKTGALAPGAYIVRTEGSGEIREVQISVVR